MLGEGGVTVSALLQDRLAEGAVSQRGAPGVQTGAEAVDWTGWAGSFWTS